MKVKFSNRDYALFSRYSWMNVHTANPDINLVRLNRAYEWWQPNIHAVEDSRPLLVMNSVVLDGTQMQQAFAEKIVNNCAKAAPWQEESLLGNRRCLFVMPKVLGLCMHLWVFSKSKNSKQDSKGISSCRENGETLCWCSTMSRGEQPLKLSLPIRAANCFLLLHKFIGVELVRKT
jgi:hypothetical protein